MQMANVKAMVAKMFTVGLLAGAVAIAAPQKAQAQVAFGLRVGPVVVHGGPVYPAPVYGYGYAAPAYGYYGHEGYARPYGWDRREAFDRREDRREEFRRDERRDFRR